jgi:hypothetical protein
MTESYQVQAASAANIEAVPASERLTLENDALRVTVWPRMGGKIVSIVTRCWDGEHELLHPPIHPYSAATNTSAFELSDAGGWDECLPSVAACRYGGADIPDHGDLWRKPWEASLDGISLVSSVHASSVPLRFTRGLSLNGAVLAIDYSAENIGTQPAEFLWSAHPLFQVSAGDRIVLPISVSSVLVEASSHGLLTQPEDRCSWPRAQLIGGGSIDLSTVGPRDGRTSHKLFAGPLTSGWCGLYRAELRMGIVMRFDPVATQFVGMWISQGAWPQGSEARQYTVALEPTTSPGDALDSAGRLGFARTLAPGATFSWPLHLEVAGFDRPVTLEQFQAFASLHPSADSS